MNIDTDIDALRLAAASAGITPLSAPFQPRAIRPIILDDIPWPFLRPVFS